MLSILTSHAGGRMHCRGGSGGYRRPSPSCPRREAAQRGSRRDVRSHRRDEGAVAAGGAPGRCAKAARKARREGAGRRAQRSRRARPGRAQSRAGAAARARRSPAHAGVLDLQRLCADRPRTFDPAAGRARRRARGARGRRDPASAPPGERGAGNRGRRMEHRDDPRARGLGERSAHDGTGTVVGSFDTGVDVSPSGSVATLSRQRCHQLVRSLRRALFPVRFPRPRHAHDRNRGGGQCRRFTHRRGTGRQVDRGQGVGRRRSRDSPRRFTRSSSGSWLPAAMRRTHPTW